MAESHVVLDRGRVPICEGEMVADFRERFDRDPDGGVVALAADGTPWRYLEPGYELQEHVPDGTAVEID